MSDTKALQDLVAKALANWGNGEAQDAFEALMGRLKDAEEDVVILNEALAEEHTKAEGAYARGLEVHAEEAQRAEADNAALLKWVSGRDCHEVFSGDDCIESNLSPEEMCSRCRIVSSPHPGAALLEELEGLRTENERLRQERNHWEGRASLTATEVARQVVREPIAIRVEGIPETMRAIIERDAHNAALEEAAKVAGDRVRFTSAQKYAAVDAKDLSKSDYWLHRQQEADHLEEAIRALKKTGQGA